MNLRGSKINIISGLLSLGLLGLVLFVSVYNQIIVQNEGFFYMIAFGGILILAYVLLGLMTKLIAISPQTEDKIIWNILEIFIYIVLIVSFAISRVRYVTLVNPEEELFYKVAVFLDNNSLAEGLDIVTKCINNPTQYVYGYLLHIVFSIFSENGVYITYLNCLLIILCAVMAGRCTRKICGRICGVITLAFSLFIPSQLFAVYSYDSTFITAFFFFLFLNIFLLIYTRYFSNPIFGILLSVLLGIIGGCLIFTEPLFVVLVVLLYAFSFPSKREAMYEPLVSFFSNIVSFAILLFIKTNILKESFGIVFSGFVKRFNFLLNPDTGTNSSFSEVFSSFVKIISNQSLYITDNFSFLSGANGKEYTAIQAAWFQLGTQLIFLFVVVLSIGCACYLMRTKNPRIIPCFIALFSLLFVMFSTSLSEEHTFILLQLLLISGSSALGYMYESHHSIDETAEIELEAEGIQEDEEDDDASSEEEKLRIAEALIFIGENDSLYNAIKQQEAENRPIREKEEEKDSPFESSSNDSYIDAEDEDSDIDYSKHPETITEHVPLPGEPLISPLPLPKKKVSKPMDYDDYSSDDTAAQITAKNDNTDESSKEEISTPSLTKKELRKQKKLDKQLNKRKKVSDKTASFNNDKTKHLDGIDTKNAKNGEVIYLSDEYYDFDVNDDDDDFDI